MQKTALILETKSYFPTVLGCKPQLPFLPPPQQDCTAWKSARPAPQDARICRKAVRRGVFGAKEELNGSRSCYWRYKCPGGTAHLWKKRQGECRQLHKRTKGQAGGWMPSFARRRNPRAKQGQWDYRSKQGLLARVEMGRAQPLVSTLAYIEQMPPHRRPYVTLYLGRLQNTVFLHNSPFLQSGGKSPPLELPDQPRAHGYRQKTQFE